MLYRPQFSMRPSLLSCFVIFAALSTSQLSAATDAEVAAAISKGASFMQSHYDKGTVGEQNLIALAMYKAGVPKTAAPIQRALEVILAKFKNDQYLPGGEHLYEAAIEASFLLEIDPVKYKPNLQLLADYIVSLQMDTGGWDYPNGGHSPKSVGDTSVMQYASLGLWAAEHAGVEVDQQVWQKALDWHVKYQNADGGYSYCPGLTVGDGMGQSMLNMAVNAVGSAHIAIFHIDPTFMPLKDEVRREKKEDEVDTSKFGILEQVELKEPTDSVAFSARVTPAAVTSVRRTFNFVKTRFRVDNSQSNWCAYYYYSLERMAAFADVDMVGQRDWFQSCADFLISKQKPDGSWALSNNFDDAIDTAFSVLFLTRSTGRLLQRVETATFGDGLLAGGRGLPDDLSNADFNGRQMVKKEPPKEPLDKLLASLSNTGNLDALDGVQEKIVEQIQLGDREELVGQVNTLIKLVDHPDAAIRQTAVWALGRTGNMHLAKYLIERLSDEDLAVMIEARNALCWISRKPLGFGFAEDPLAELPPNASVEDISSAVAQWHKDLVMTWGEWYLTNRPFEDRGDAFEANLRRQMEKLKYGF